MKKFNLREAKEGNPVITRNKKDVKILTFTRDNLRFPIVAIIENEQVACYTLKGKFYDDVNHKQSKNDLFMK